jgi:hypothetical protein
VGARFSAPVQNDPGAHPASYTVDTVYFPGVKRPGRGVDHPLPSSAKVKESRAIPLLPFWALVACSRVNFTFTFTSVSVAGRAVIYVCIYFIYTVPVVGLQK